MSAWDQRFFGDAPRAVDRDVIERQMVDYMNGMWRRSAVPWRHIARHMLGLRHGLPGARRWRQVWSDHRLADLPAQRVSDLAREAVSA
jgi:tRNA-dihydrouridine synthase A